MSRFFRLLPATIVTSVIFLGVKVSDLVHDTESLFVSSVEAQTIEKPSNVSTEKPKSVSEAKIDSKPKVNTAKPEDNKSENKTESKEAEKKPEEKKSVESKGDDKKAEEKTSEEKPDSPPEHKEGEKKDKENPAVSKQLEETTEHRYTAVEVELLQSLSKRREELERWENNIQIKEAMLDATQKRIDDKIKQIEAMKKQVATLLAQYNTQEDAKIHSLVKIYENMKPVEAARIFDEVEMPILLLVIDAMAEKKAAPILAAMTPQKAKQLTVELANERKINTKITSGVEANIAPAQAETPANSASPASAAQPANPRPASDNKAAN